MIKAVWSIFNSHKQFTTSGQKGKEPSQGGTLEFTGQFFLREKSSSRLSENKRKCIDWFLDWLIDWFSNRKPWGCYEGEYKDCWNLCTSFPNFHRQGMYKQTLNKNITKSYPKINIDLIFDTTVCFYLITFNRRPHTSRNTSATFMYLKEQLLRMVPALVLQ